MTSMSFNQASSFNTTRPLYASFAARLAGLQARHERAMDYLDVAGVVGRGVLALVPSLAIAWMFVSL